MGRAWRPYNVGPYHLGTLFNKRVGQPEAVIRWRDETGVPRRKLLGVFSEAEGRAKLDQFVSLQRTISKELESPTVQKIWDEYVADRAKDGKKMRPFHESWGALKSRFATMRVSDITDDVCRDYGDMRMKAGRIIRKKDGSERRVPISVGTVWTELLRLRSCINWAATRNRLNGPAPHIWIPKKPPPRKHVLTPEEFVMLLNACREPHTRLFCMLAITTTARSGAILELTWDRVDYAEKSIDFRMQMQPSNPLSKEAQKARVKAPMTEEVEQLLMEAQRKAQSNHVIEFDFKPVMCIRKSFNAAVRRAGLPRHITPHVLRHTAITWLDDAGVPVEAVSKLAGHSDPSITRTHYRKTLLRGLRGVAETIEGMVADAKDLHRLQIDHLQSGDAK